MITFLLIISFLLHGVTAIALIILSLRVSKAKELELKQERVAREIEESFTAYLIEIKEENERLTNMLEKNGHTVDVKDNSTGFFGEDKPKAEPIRNDKESNQASEQPSLQPQETPGQYNKENIYEPPSLSLEEQDSYEPSLQSKILQMFNEGYSTEQIAKQLDCGKTEVDLMLKFHQRNS